MTAALRVGDNLLGPIEVDALVLRAARSLERAGVGEGGVVAIMMRNEPRFVLLLLAARRIGAYALPINWHFRQDEVGHILNDSGCRLLLVHSDLLPQIVGAVHASCSVVRIAPGATVRAAYAITAMDLPDDWSAWLADTPTTSPPRPSRTPMGYTSGTTGKPKGVRRGPMSAAQLARIRALNEEAFGLRAHARALVVTPLYHSAPNIYAMTAKSDGELLVLEPRFDAERTLALIQRHRITHAYMVPTLFVRLLQLPGSVRKRYDTSSLEVILHGAAPCPTAVKGGMIEWLGPVIQEFYGGSEAGPITRCTSSEWREHPGSVGRPVSGVEVIACDDAGNAMPPDRVGTIFIHQTNYPDFTYHGRDDQRAAAAHPTMTGFFTLGDIGYLDRSGYLFLTDRKSDMIVSGGVNVYPAEIEAALLAMPGVRDCAVLGAPDPEFGERIVAVVEPAPGATLTSEHVLDFLRERLAGYKLPRIVELSESLPREESGKIFKRKLRAA